MQLFKVVCLGHYFYRLHIVSSAVIRGIAGTFYWRYNSTSFHWCLLVPYIGYKPWAGPWGTIVNRGEWLWNPTDFFVVGCWDHVSYGEPRLTYQPMYRSKVERVTTDMSTDASVVTRSTFDRCSTHTRPTSNQCHYRYSVNLATDMYISTLKWGLVDFPKNLHTKPICRLWIIQERLASQPFQIW